MDPRFRSPRETTAADQYRREAARLRTLADNSTFGEVRDELTGIAQEYEALARQRDDIVRRYGGR